MVVFAVGCESNGGNNSIITPGPERPDEDPEDGPVVGPGTEEDGMTIEISVTDISAYSAMLTVTPSTDDKYACVFISSAQWPDMIEGDAAVKYIVDNFDPALFQGEYSEELQPLMPDTEYMVIALATMVVWLQRSYLPIPLPRLRPRLVALRFWISSS